MYSASRQRVHSSLVDTETRSNCEMPMTQAQPVELAQSTDSWSVSTPCRTNDADLWFAERAQDIELAKMLCRTCPLVAECLAGALDRQEPWGVWGGEYLNEGAIVAVKRGRGRPRKNPAAAVAC